MRYKAGIFCALAYLLLLSGCGYIVADIDDRLQSRTTYDTALTDSIRFGSLEGVKEALQNGSNVNEAYVDYPFPHKVVAYNYALEQSSNPEISKYLLQNGTDISLLVDKDGKSILMDYAASPSMDSADLETLLELGADINATDDTGYTALDYAAAAGNEVKVEFLLRYDAKATLKTLKAALEGDSGLSNGSKNYGTVQAVVRNLVERNVQTEVDPIILAAILGNSHDVTDLCNFSDTVLSFEDLNWLGSNASAFCNADALEACVKLGFSLEEVEYGRYDRYSTPLSLAAEYGNIETLCWLENRENYSEMSRYEAFREAVKGGWCDEAEYLLNSGVTIHIEPDIHVLTLAAESGNGAMVDLLLAHISEPIEDNVLTQAFGQAVRNGFVETAAMLLPQHTLSQETLDQMTMDSALNLEALKLCVSIGADPTDGEILLTAATYGHYDVAEYVIKMGADVNYSSESECVLKSAVAGGFLDIVKLLIDHGADVNIKNDLWGTPLMVAAKSSAHITKLLLEHGAEVNYQRGDGGTALMDAVIYGQLQCAQELLEAGANPDLQNLEGQSARQLVFDSSNDKMKELFDLANY